MAEHENEVPEEEEIEDEALDENNGDEHEEVPVVATAPLREMEPVESLANPVTEDTAATWSQLASAPDVDWNAIEQATTRVMQNWKGFHDLQLVVNHNTRQDGYRRDLERAIQEREELLSKREAQLREFESDIDTHRKALHAQMVSEQQRTSEFVQEMAARRELARNEAIREEQECEARIGAARQRTEEETARIEANMADMRKAEDSFKRRMVNMRGKIEELTGA